MSEIRWISIAEQLPPEETMVLVFLRWRANEYARDVALMDSDHSFYDDEAGWDYTGYVTHWCPIDWPADPKNIEDTEWPILEPLGFRDKHVLPPPRNQELSIASDEMQKLTVYLDQFGDKARGDTMLERVQHLVRYYVSQVGRLHARYRGK